MVIFMSLIVPMPYTAKRKIFTFISENPLVAKVQYGMKITFIFILILFLDSVNRVYRVQEELSSARKSESEGRYVIVLYSGFVQSLEAKGQTQCRGSWRKRTHGSSSSQILLST